MDTKFFGIWFRPLLDRSMGLMYEGGGLADKSHDRRCDAQCHQQTDAQRNEYDSVVERYVSAEIERDVARIVMRRTYWYCLQLGIRQTSGLNEGFVNGRFDYVFQCEHACVVLSRGLHVNDGGGRFEVARRCDSDQADDK